MDVVWRTCGSSLGGSWPLTESEVFELFLVSEM